MSQKTALITGVTGQDGAILAQIVLHKGYEVHGMRPYLPVSDDARIQDIDGLHLHYGDMTDSGSLVRLLGAVKPDEIYNMAAMTHVHVSFDVPDATAQINALGPLRLLEAMRTVQAEKEMKLYQASSSEMFGRSPAPQNEDTPFAPCSPYGTAKLYAYWTVRNYREAYGLFAANGILFNHESPMRGENFVTQKIVRAACALTKGQSEVPLKLGNLDAKRDWGHAADYMEGVWKILQHDKPDDFVLATGQAHSVRDFVTKVYAHVGYPIAWEKDIGVCQKTNKVLIETDQDFMRPQDIQELIGDASKAKKVLGWQPRYSLDDLIADMIHSEMTQSPMRYVA